VVCTALSPHCLDISYGYFGDIAGETSSSGANLRRRCKDNLLTDLATVIRDPEDKNFDLEKYLNAEFGSK
jgi:hypothetical protein